MLAALSKYSYFKTMQVYRQPVSRIVALGVEIPSKVVDNDTIAAMVDASPELKRSLPKLIFRATKCLTRVHAEAGTSPSDLAVAAARKVLQQTGVAPDSIDVLIFASTDMDVLEPATANIVQKKLGLKLTNSFDVTNACNSTLQALNIANSMIISGAARRILITSGENGSYFCNRQLQNTKELETKMGGLTLGDAGAALLIEASDGSAGLLEINLMSKGEHWELCHVPEITDWRQRQGSIHGWFYLDMPELAKLAKSESIAYFQQYMQLRNELHGEASAYDHLAQIIPHQISRKFIEDICKPFTSDLSRICITADIYGNTASTSTFLALQSLLDRNVLRFGSGQEILLYGAASGFSIGHLRIRL